MKIVASSDIHHLETLLLERFDRRALPGDKLSSLLGLVPTARLLGRRRIRKESGTPGRQDKGRGAETFVDLTSSATS